MEIRIVRNRFVTLVLNGVKKFWFIITCFRPVTKYEYYNLKKQLIVILDGMRESDLQHYTTERMIIEELKALVELNQKKMQRNNDEKDNSGMFN